MATSLVGPLAAETERALLAAPVPRPFHPKIDRVTVVQNCPIELIIKNFLGNPSETINQLQGD